MTENIAEITFYRCSGCKGLWMQDRIDGGVCYLCARDLAERRAHEIVSENRSLVERIEYLEKALKKQSDENG